jgi:hypothetical protein
MAVFPCRLSFDNLITSLVSPCKKYVDKVFKNASLWETAQSFIATFLIIGSGYFLAIWLPEVDIVFSLTGSTASACTSYIFPSLF